VPVPPEASPIGAPSISEFAYWVGGLVAAIVAGWLGYSRKPKPPTATATVLGALVDNSAVSIVADALTANTAELRALRAVIARDLADRETIAQERDLRDRIEAESRMRELLEILEQKVAERRA
jgi:hypothetical protein